MAPMIAFVPFFMTPATFVFCRLLSPWTGEGLELARSNPWSVDLVVSRLGARDLCVDASGNGRGRRKGTLTQPY